MGKIRIDPVLLLISVLGHYWDTLECEVHTKQSLRTGRLVEDMNGNNWELE